MPPAQSSVSYKDAQDAEAILFKYFNEDKSQWPEPLALACTESAESRIALGLCLVFLDKLLLCETSIPVANFEWVSNLDE